MEPHLDLPGFDLASLLQRTQAPLGPGVSGSAVISDCGSYRYRLWRRWGSGSYVCFVGLNPSTADAVTDDATIKKCIKYARAWGHEALCMVNLFAFRATEPRDMKRATDPVGPDNDRHLIEAVSDAGLVVVAWGVDGGHRDRAYAVLKLLKPLCVPHAFALTKTGEPRHPLYLRDSLAPTPLGLLGLPRGE